MDKDEMKNKISMALKDPTLQQEFEIICKELEAQIKEMKCCYNCSKDCDSIDRRICFENKMKDWELSK